MRAIISAAAWTTGMATTIVCLLVLTLAAPLLRPMGVSRLARLCFRIATAAFFVRVRVRGRERVEPQRPQVFMANHASFIDFFVLAAYLPGLHRGLEAAEHFRWPLWGHMLQAVGMLPIDRSSAAASLRSLKGAAQRIKEGVSILILPEGTRTVGGELQAFRRLAFHLPKEAGCAIVPVGLRGTFRFKNKKSWLVRPGRVEMIFGEPIDEATVRELDTRALAELTRTRVAALLSSAPPVASR